jgi:hypothetical protein
MDFVPGQRMADCFDNLSRDAKLNTAKEIATIAHTLYRITSGCCGSVFYAQSSQHSHEELAYPTVHKNKTEKHSFSLLPQDTIIGKLLIGPLNEGLGFDCFGDPTKVVPTGSCGPFLSEQAYVTSFTWRGGRRFLQPASTRAIYEKLTLLWKTVRPKYEYPSNVFASQDCAEVFHFSHGDLSEINILLDPETGSVTGVLDWELAGFYPSWRACVTMTRFNDDQCRYIMGDLQEDGPLGYDQETEDEREARELYYTEVARRSDEMSYYDRKCVELRGLFYNMVELFPGNSFCWIEIYQQQLWDTEVSGPFPFDLAAWSDWYRTVSAPISKRHFR